MTLQLTDLVEVKAILEIDADNPSEDVKLSFFIEQASEWIMTLLAREDLTQKSRTETYQGTGTQKICLNARPVYQTPTPIVYVDTNGYFGAASGAFGSGTQLTYGQDFTVEWDQQDGSSRSGILWRINDYWPKQPRRQVGLLTSFLGPDMGSVRVTYTAGWTVDNLPSVFRMACNALVAKLRYYFPLAAELGGEGYEERSISIIGERKNYLVAGILPMISQWMNRRW